MVSADFLVVVLNFEGGFEAYLHEMVQSGRLSSYDSADYGNYPADIR